MPTATSGSSRPRCDRARWTRSSGQERVCEQLSLLLAGGPVAAAGARPRAAQRSARAGQDDAGDDHRRRDGGPAAPDQRSGDHPRGRPRRHPLRAQRGRRPLRRRDPPDVAAGRGDALHGDGGLPGRRRHRQGSGRHGHPARHPAVHPGRSHHPGRPAARPAARPVRVHRPPGVLRARGPRADRAALRRPARHRRPEPGAHRGGLALARHARASPTGCCAGCATTPRCVPTGSSPASSRGPPSSSSRSTSRASTGSTGPCSTRCAAASVAARWG